MKTHWSVNWKDGMKVESAQFLKERSYNNDRLRLSRIIELNDYNFGLFMDQPNEYLKYEILGSQLRIKECRAITRTGNIIFVNQQNAVTIPAIDLEQIVKDYDEGEMIQFYIRVFPDEYKGFGEIDEQEFPYRMPDACVKYEIEYMNLSNALPLSQLTHSIPFMQMKRVISGYEVVSKYIPPVYAMNAYKDLVGWHHELNNFNFELAKLNSVTSQNIAMMGEHSFILKNTHMLTSRLATFIADGLDDFTYNYINKSPLDVFLFYKKIGRLFSAILGNMENKREMVNFMAEKTNHSVEHFLEAVNKLNMSEYDHLNIRELKDRITDYTKMMIILFRKLSSDLPS